MESKPSPEENKNTENVPKSAQNGVVNESKLFTKEGLDTIKTLNSEYNALEFRVDMFLDKLCSVWWKHDFTPNKLIKVYLGDEIPENQYDTDQILPENIEFYKDCITRAFGTLRMICDIPIIYTVRTKFEGGKLGAAEVEHPQAIDTNNIYDLYNQLTLFGAVQLNAEIIDVEFSYEHNIKGVKHIVEQATNNLIIASKHFINHENLFDHQQLASTLKVHEGSFDIIKVVSNFGKLDYFNSAKKIFMDEKFTQPIIHINLGEKMKITRVLNTYLTPVSCLDISKEATGPGQLGKEEIVNIRKQLSMDIEDLKLYILGSPVEKSPSPTFHNKVFELLGLPYTYKRFDTDHIDWAMHMINKEDTIGCSVTIPLKKELFLKFKEHASADAKYIQAINTII